MSSVKFTLPNNSSDVLECEASTETDPLECKSVSTETTTPTAKFVQTDESYLSTGKNSAVGIRIDPGLIDMIIEQIKRYHLECALFSEIDEEIGMEKVSLMFEKSTSLFSMVYFVDSFNIL